MPPILLVSTKMADGMDMDMDMEAQPIVQLEPSVASTPLVQAPATPGVHDDIHLAQTPTLTMMLVPAGVDVYSQQPLHPRHPRATSARYL